MYFGMGLSVGCFNQDGTDMYKKFKGLHLLPSPPHPSPGLKGRLSMSQS